MHGLPVILTPAQRLACNGRRWMGLSQDQQMGVLITIFAEIAGMTISCETLEAAAAQYSCLPRQAQLPSLIYLATQIVQNGSTGGGGSGGVGNLFVGNFGGFPPSFTPVIVSTSFVGVSSGAIATDNSTGQQWVFYNGQWN